MVISVWLVSKVPATLWTRVVSQSLLDAEAGQDPGQALGQHGFSRPRWSDEQDVVPAGCGDFQGAFGVELAADFGEIFFQCAVGPEKRLPVDDERGGVLLSGQELDDFGKCMHAVHLDVVDDRGLTCVLGGKNQRVPVLAYHADG